MGKVFLVGAGPGDPGLLTVKALHILERAEVVLYDRLVSAEILALSPHPAVAAGDVEVAAPAVFVIGEVVRLRARLAPSSLAEVRVS